MKPHPDMTREEKKKYVQYVFNNDLTSEERQTYRDWVSDAEDEFGCCASSIPLEDMEGKTDDEIWEMLQHKRAERRQRNADRVKTNLDKLAEKREQ